MGHSLHLTPLLLLLSVGELNQRGFRHRRGREVPALALIAGAHTDIWLEMGDLGT
jgi:hypothetical protein